MIMKFALRLPLIILNVAIALAMLATGYTYHLSPLRWPFLALGGYVFPLFAVAAILMMLMWLFIKKRYMLISFVALLLAYQPATLYCPLNPSGLDTATATVPAPSQSPDSPSPSDSSISPSLPHGEGRGGAFTVLSYNTCYWGRFKEEGETISHRERMRNVLLYLRSTRADVICLQEAALSAEALELFDSIFAGEPRYYIDTVASARPGGLPMTVITRFPIAGKQRIDLVSKSNNAAAFWLSLDTAAGNPDISTSIPSGEGRGGAPSLLLINCHLETVGMSIAEKAAFSTTMHDMARGHTEGSDSLRSFSRFILGKLSAAAQKRAPQAEAISDFIARQLIANPDLPLLVCGDFNDIPLSYTHYRIQHPVLNGNDNVNANANPAPSVPVPVGVPVPVPSAGEAPLLTDCYQAAGFGPGFTIYQNAMRVRIDNILCSPALTPVSARIDKSVRYSDHYPIMTRLDRTER